MYTLKTRKINYTGMLLVVLISLLRWPCVSAQDSVTGKAESTESRAAETSQPTTLPANFPKCIASCLDDKGVNIPTGDYAFCDDCNAVAKCTYGRIDVIKCPLGTVYYDRVLGVCVSDSTVCINDSYVVASPTESILTTSATTETASTSTTETSSTTAATETISTSTISPIPTTVTLTSTTESTTPAVEISQSSLSSTPPKPTASTSEVETTNATTNPATITTTVSSTTPAVPVPTTADDIPTTGPEAESLMFVLDFYNRFSLDNMRAGVLGIKSVTKQHQETNNGTWYRLYGVTLASSSCPNTSENMGTTNQKCPPIVPVSAGSGQSSVTECSFKVNYNIQTNNNKQLDMVYMMCYQGSKT